MDVKIVSKTDIYLGGLKVELTASQKENYRIIREHWHYFNSQLRIRKITTDLNWVKYGVFTKVHGVYYYLSAIPADYEIVGFESFVIAGGQFAKFCHQGSLREIKSTVNDIYRSILPKYGLKIDERRSFIHYEQYDNRFYWNRSDSIIEIFVPLVS